MGRWLGRKFIKLRCLFNCLFMESFSRIFIKLFADRVELNKCWSINLIKLLSFSISLQFVE